MNQKEEIYKKVVGDLYSLFKVENVDDVYYLNVGKSIRYRINLLHLTTKTTYLVVGRNDSNLQIGISWFFHKTDSKVERVYENFMSKYTNDVFYASLEDEYGIV